MKLSILDKICESYLIKNEVYTQTSYGQFQKIKSYLVNEVHSLLNNLYENDIEIYHKFVDRPIYLQIQIVEHYLKLKYVDDTILTEGFLLTTGAYLAFIAIVSKPASKIMAKGLEAIGNIADKTGQFISTLGKELKLRYAIVYKNLESCYADAGVKSEDVGALHYLGVNDDPVTPQLSANIVKQTEKLKECYVKYQIETLSMLFKSYSLCLMKTGDTISIKKLQDDDILKVISGLQLSTACKEYYETIKQSFDNFYKLLDLIYDKDSKKTEKMQDLKNELIKARDFSSKQNIKPFDNKDGKPSYPNNKYDQNKNVSDSAGSYKQSQGKQFDKPDKYKTR